MNSDVYVVIEHLRGKLAEVSFELLGKGRELADQRGARLTAVVLGHNTGALAAELGVADRIIAVDHPDLADFNPEAYAANLIEVVRAGSPAVTLLATSSMGMDIAGAIAVAMNIPLVAYAVDVRSENGALIVTSQLYGGKLNVESQVDAPAVVISMLAGSSLPDKGRRAGAASPVEAFQFFPGSQRVRFRRLLEPEAGGVDITAQDILVSVGRGIQSADNLPLMEELARGLGGAVAASRPIVDSKWLPKTRQVGKSGVKVKPRLYLSVGISGAPEHIEGMKDSELIIAINSDPAAPIFDYAHYGVVADLFDIVPALNARLKE